MWYLLVEARVMAKIEYSLKLKGWTRRVVDDSKMVVCEQFLLRQLSSGVNVFVNLIPSPLRWIGGSRSFFVKGFVGLLNRWR